MTDQIPSSYVSGLFDGGVNVTLRIKSDEMTPCGYRFSPGLRFETDDSPELVGVLAEFSERHDVFHEAGQTKEGFVWFVTGTDRVKILLEKIEDEVYIASDDIELMLDEIIPRLENDVHHTEEGILELMEYVEQLEWRKKSVQFNHHTRESLEEEFDVSE